MTAVITDIEPELRTQTVSELNNGEAYYFALSALSGEGVESPPGGGDISVTPGNNIITIGDVLTITNLSHTVTALTGDSAVLSIDNDGLTHTRDYTLSISPDASGNIRIDNDGTISIGAGITVSDAGDYTITAAGQNGYSGTIAGTFTLTVTPLPLTSALLGSIDNPQSDFMVTIGLTDNVTRTLSFNNSLTIGSDFTLSLEEIPQNAASGRVTLDSNTGVLTISKDVVPADSGTYSLSATGQGNYSGTAAASFEITVNRKDISGTLSYADLEVAAGQTKRSNASWNNAGSGQTVRYILVSPPAGISIDENIGVVTVDTAVLTADTSCSIRAEGIELYTGERTATLSIFIRDWIPSSAALTYTDIRVSTGSSETSSPQWVGGSYEVKYSMVPLNGGILPDEINIDPSSGVITVSSTAAAQADTIYQVTATGTGNWKGWKKTKIHISVYDSFYYEFQPALVDQAFSLSPGNAPASVEYSASPSLPDGLDLEEQTGEIYGTPTIRQLAAEYTITATPTGGGTTISNNVSLLIQEQAVDKTHLWRMIDEEIAAQGNTADLGLIDTSSITDMSYLFDIATSSSASHADYSEFNGDLSGWDVSSVTNMSHMFLDADAFNGDISEWNVASVTDMESMFRDTESFNGDLSKWDVANVTNMRRMFRDAKSFNGDLSEWNVANVTHMLFMFADATEFNGDISDWDVSSVTDMTSMFYGAAEFNGDLSGWNVSRVTSMLVMFSGATKFNGDLTKWDVSSVTSMKNIFRKAVSFNGDISGWNVSNVTDMSYMFFEATNFNGDLSGWNVSNVTDMRYMFYNAKAFNGDLSGWNVSSVTDMGYMFYNAKAFNGDLESWRANLGTNVSMDEMFSGSGLANNPPSWY